MLQLLAGDRLGVWLAHWGAGGVRAVFPDIVRKCCRHYNYNFKIYSFKVLNHTLRTINNAQILAVKDKQRRIS